MNDVPPVPPIPDKPADELAPPIQPGEPERPIVGPALGEPVAPMPPEAPAPTAPTAASAAAPAASGIGVLLVNLGTPDAAEPAAVRRYLKEFLTDPRVIEKNSLLWKFMLNGIILPLRSRRKARDYQKIWNHEQGRIAAQDHHPVAGGKTRRHSRTARQACRRRLGDALCQSLDRVAARGADRARLRPHPGDAALSAICGADHRDGVRRGVPLSDAAAPTAGAAHPAGLLRRSLLHRGAGILAEGRAQGAAVSSRT